jgi:hypothetical protein
MVNFPCPNHRNKGLKPLAANDLVTVESGFQAQQHQVLNPLPLPIAPGLGARLLGFCANM